MFVTFGETELTCLCMLYFMAAYSQPVVIAADGLDVIRSQFKQNVRERNTKYKWDLRENKWYTLENGLYILKQCWNLFQVDTTMSTGGIIKP